MEKDKRETWEQIKTKDPQLAALIIAINKTFGKPKVTVKLK